MKSLMLITLAFASLSANATGLSPAIKTIQGLKLHEFYCDVMGRTQGADHINVGNTLNIMAENETEAIKLCLLKTGAAIVNFEQGVPAMVSTTNTFGDKPVVVDSISIRKGMM